MSDEVVDCFSLDLNFLAPHDLELVVPAPPVAARDAPVAFGNWDGAEALTSLATLFRERTDRKSVV